MKNEKLIKKIKDQTEQLWNTIQEAEKANLEVSVGFYSNFGRVRPEIRIVKVLYKD
jgi:hypothetical protein